MGQPAHELYRTLREGLRRETTALCSDMRGVVADTRKVIDQSNEVIRGADRLLDQHRALFNYVSAD